MNGTDEGRFQDALDIVLAHEGGFVRNPFDPGGATKFGITQRTLAGAREGRASVDDVRRLTRAEAARIYRRFYWDAIRASEMPPGVALAVFDLAVNSGVGRAVRMLQSTLGVDVDGIVGKQTLRAIAKADEPDLIRRLTRARLGFLARLATWSIFGRGWRRRVLSIEQDAISAARASAPSPEGQSS